MTLAYFGCLRASEFCVISKFNKSKNLTINDITLGLDSDLPYLLFILNLQKQINVVRVSSVCAVCAMQTYLFKRNVLYGEFNA